LAISTRDINSNVEQRPRAIEESDPGAGRRWLLRGLGAVLLVAGWAVVSFVGGPIVSAVVFALLGGYAYFAAANSRRNSVDEEKRLRMDLLVHNMELEKLATKDELTQLYNRSYFVERLQRELKNARGFGRPVSVLLIDIDGMTAINAEHGQQAGDEVLAEFGRFLLAQTRASDLPARIDGDCFGVILPDTADDGAQIMIERLTAALPEKAMYDDGTKTIEVSVSLGLAGYPWSNETLDDILNEAELAKAASKRANQAPVRIDSDEPVPAIFRKAEADAELHQ
jgi:diguanylate cyclase (GGDEF)-like protein